VVVNALPGQPPRFPGIDTKLLLDKKETGLQRVLPRRARGAVLTDHLHVVVEQTGVLEGCLVVDAGEARAGSFVWRPAGSRHAARAPDGALLLGFFLRPNTFF
jgi:anti-sigma factor ChrR (cupin superfamily)